MPNLHDLERRINSVSSTKQITRTMEMVAAAKIHRSTERMQNMMPFAVAVSDMLLTVAKYAPIGVEELLAGREEIKRTVIIVMTSDRGLAGGFNSNVLRYAEKLMEKKQAEGIEVDVIACGKKAIGYFNYRHIKPVLEFRDMSADPQYDESAIIGNYIAEGYASGEIDEVISVFNHAKNGAEQQLIEQGILPISKQTLDELINASHLKEKDVLDDYREKEEKILGDVEFEPDAETVLHWVTRAGLLATVQYALVDSAAGEQSARRNAMKSATDNANEMVETLTRVYNSVRQGAITTEITEIVGGAAALED